MNNVFIKYSFAKALEIDWIPITLAGNAVILHEIEKIEERIRLYKHKL